MKWVEWRDNYFSTSFCFFFQLSGSYSGLDNITQVVSKLENVMEKIETGVTWKDRLFDPSVWNPVLQQLTNWQMGTNLDLG